MDKKPEEIEFLATLLLNDNLDKETKVSIINRIISISKPLPSPPITVDPMPYSAGQWVEYKSPICEVIATDNLTDSWSPL